MIKQFLKPLHGLEKGTVKFFCACGKEIWQELSDDQKERLTISRAESQCQCSDCILEQLRKECYREED